MPAKAGIQAGKRAGEKTLDSGFRRNDGIGVRNGVFASAACETRKQGELFLATSKRDVREVSEDLPYFGRGALQAGHAQGEEKHMKFASVVAWPRQNFRQTSVDLPDSNTHRVMNSGPEIKKDTAGGKIMINRRWGLYPAVFASLALSGCAATSVQPVYERTGTALPPPEVILVYRFAVSADDVTPNQGFLAQTAASFRSTPMDEQKRQTATEAADRFANALVTGINQLGLQARLASGPHEPSAKEVLLTGAFVDIDEGNRLQQLTIGLGAGQTRLDARMRLTTASQGRELVLARFEAHADSGEMPGAAITMGAGAAAQGGLTAGMVAANVAAGGIKAYRSSIDPMLDRTAQEALVTLSHYFASQDWIPSDKVMSLTWQDL